MAATSIFQAYNVASSRTRDFPLVHPLELAPALRLGSEIYEGPLLIVGIVAKPDDQILKSDLLGRDPRGYCTHMNATLCNGKAAMPVTLAHGPSCGLTGWQNGVVRSLYPELDDEYDQTYGKVKKLGLFGQAWSECWDWIKPGEIYGENWLVCDNLLYIRRDPRQMKNIIEKAAEWIEEKNKYQLSGWMEPNCQRPAEALQKAGEIPLLSPFKRGAPWPIFTRKFIDDKVKHGIHEQGPFHYFSRQDVLQMFEANKDEFAQRKSTQPEVERYPMSIETLRGNRSTARRSTISSRRTRYQPSPRRMTSYQQFAVDQACNAVQSEFEGPLLHRPLAKRQLWSDPLLHSLSQLYASL